MNQKDLKAQKKHWKRQELSYLLISNNINYERNQVWINKIVTAT